MYIRIFMYIHILICTYIYIYTHIYIYVCMYVYTYVYVCIYICICIYRHTYIHIYLKPRYGVATMSRRLKIIGLFCKRALQKRHTYIYRTYGSCEVATMSRLLKIIGLFLQNIVSFIGLFFNRDL